MDLCKYICIKITDIYTCAMQKGDKKTLYVHCHGSQISIKGNFIKQHNALKNKFWAGFSMGKEKSW